jgi:integrase
MAQLSPNSVQILDGTITLKQRSNSAAWQAHYKIANKWLRNTTKQTDLEKAKKTATDMYLRAKYREEEGLPIVSKRFDAVARIVKQKLQAAINANEAKVVFNDYITAIDKYLIPFFGSYNVATIDYKLIKEFADWRNKKLGRITKSSTINTHNSVLNRIFEEGVANGYLNKTQIPLLQNKGVKAERRPNFTLDEYRKLVRFMRKWVSDVKGKRNKVIDMRFLLRDYVLILTNSGMRHGTESYGIKWKDLSWHVDNGRRVLMISVKGKVGQRELAARHNCTRYFERIYQRTTDLQQYKSLDELIEKGVDEYVFRLADGTKTENLAHAFTRLLKEADLLVDRQTNTNRSLYSLRHTYATFALLYEKIDVFDLEVQMGTSVGMIRKHYAHIKTRQIAARLVGKDFGSGKNDRDTAEDDIALLKGD